MHVLFNALLITACLSLIARWAISLGSYSGEGKGPMYGDYEAQRHWMEITTHLTPLQWYKNSSDNDLQYWGLDYPPLTAYHSYICGKLAEFIDPRWVQLGASRGHESYNHKFFMRSTVMLVDVIIFFPAIIAFTIYHAKVTNSHKVLLCSTMLLYPGLLLIDHGHFQYNCVSLGLFVWAVVALGKHYDLLASALFCLSLNYKQMELYHAVPFFCFLLAKTLKAKRSWRILKLLALAVVVVSTFALCWLPFLQDKQAVIDILHRLFPFDRGLYEDKVANIWCSLSLLVKVKEKITKDVLVTLCLAATSVTLLPSSLDLLLAPSFRKFKVALMNSSLIFFLLSYQVHEKSILIPAMSACLLLDESPLLCLWFLTMSTFSMLPLLHKDGHLITFCASLTAFVIISFQLHAPFSQPYFITRQKLRRFAKFMVFLSLLGCIALTVASVFVPPPISLPDIYPVLISTYSCVHFVVFLIYFHYLQFTIHSTNQPSNKTAMQKKKNK